MNLQAAMPIGGHKLRAIKFVRGNFCSLNGRTPNKQALGAENTELKAEAIA